MTTLLPRVAARIEATPGRITRREPEKLYEYLKALSDARRAEVHETRSTCSLSPTSSGKRPTMPIPTPPRSLSNHFQSLLDYGNQLRPIATNPTLIAQARNTIRQASIPSLIYSRLRREVQGRRRESRPARSAAGVGAEKALRRKSGVSLTEPIPSFFSRAGFTDVATKQVPDLVKGFAADDWVWGDENAAARSLKMGQAVEDLYEQDYIETWDKVLNDLDLAPFSSAEQAADVLAALAAPATSPLRGVLGAVSENTQLVQQTPAGQTPGAVDAAKKAITDRLGGKAVTDKLGGLFGASAATRAPGVIVTAHFQPIHRLMAGEPGNAPIDAIILRIGQVEHQLRTLGASGSLEACPIPS